MCECAGQRSYNPHRSDDVRAAADHVLTAALKRALPAAFPRDNYLCFPCTCQSTRCFRCMQLSSAVRTAQRAGVLDMACPVCDAENDGSNKRGRSSKHVKAFADAVWQCFPSAAIIWDWNCLQAAPRMSIDATVLCGQGCAQFEIDSGIHFQHNLVNRSRNDEVKDTLICQQQLCVLRLHFRDQERWKQYIVKHVNHPQPNIQYTQAFMECLRGESNQNRIMQL